MSLGMLRTAIQKRTLRTISSTAGPTRTFHAVNNSNSRSIISQALKSTNIKPVTSQSPTLIRLYNSTVVKQDKIDLKHEHETGLKKLVAHPEIVSATSSTHSLLKEVATEDKKEDETDMMAGVRNDMKTIKETFSLHDVPVAAYYVGMAGVLPYLATSLSTVYCAWEINHASVTGTGFLMSGRTAELLLHIIEPLQIGWGAVIISFLGAIHWGLEWANYGGRSSMRRYAIGMLAPAVAWPSILLPVETALIAQFLAFNFLYYADSRQTKRGLAPPWYGMYRFVLTFIVGSSIVVSLIGRGHISDQIGKMPGPADRIRALRAAQDEELEKEDEVRRNKKNKDSEDDDEEGEGGETDEE